MIYYVQQNIFFNVGIISKVQFNLETLNKLNSFFNLTYNVNLNCMSVSI